jgi:sigma-54 dependent transcriptional regulator, acetoin dehydrogenase operon transcriptional activator AcoR
MPQRNPGHTTAPSSSSSLAALETERLALAWLFPRTDGPVLELDALAPGGTVLGRDEELGSVLAGEDVSRQHAKLERQGPLAVLTDLGSRNGTYVNGRRVTVVAMTAGDVVRIGGWVGVVTTLAGALGSLAPGLLGGPVLRAALSPVEQAAGSDLPIVLEGETGTGKESVARATHGWSRRQGPFVAVNCAALPESLAEAELFGYRRGAFTGADQASPGHFRSAHRGTLLLDEIGDLPLSIQAKLLRVLEQREVQPIGETSPVPIDVRVIVASQEPLAATVAAGRFRGDLYARLDGISVRLPPLRERRAEIPYLFARMLTEQSGGRPPSVEGKLVERLCLYDWPFNVRELGLLVKKLLVLHGAEAALKFAHLPERMLAERAPAVGAAVRGKALAHEVDLAALLDALRASGGNVSRAAAELGIPRQRAYRMMRGQGGVDLDSLRRDEEDS